MGLKNGGLRGSLRNIGTGVFAIPDSGVSRWTYDDADYSSSTLTDVWGSNDGTINGVTMGGSGLATTYDSGQSGSFDGTGDYVSTNHSIQNYPRSIAAWVDINTPSDDTLFAGVNDFQSQDVACNIGTFNGNYLFELKDGTSVISQNNTTASAGIHHIVGVASPSSIELFVDGASIGSASHSLTQATTSLDFYMGVESDAQSSLSVQYFDGRLDDVRDYRKALTSTEVSNLYQTGSISG